jgi:hypothetical protein
MVDKLDCVSEMVIMNTREPYHVLKMAKRAHKNCLMGNIWGFLHMTFGAILAFLGCNPAKVVGLFAVK